MRRVPPALLALLVLSLAPHAARGAPRHTKTASECNDAESCLAAAVGLGQGEGELDMALLLKRLSLFDRACTYGSGDGCLALARVARFVPQYQARERELFSLAVGAFERQCAGGEMQDCAMLIAMYRGGEGLPQKLDRVESAERYVLMQIARSCAQEKTAACLLLADLFSRGELGLPHSEERAKELRARATAPRAK